MPRKNHPATTGQVSKRTRTQRKFWHQLAAALADGVRTMEEVAK